MQEHLFPYDWNLSDGYTAKNIPYHGAKVFSCFACGGGSTMGYKLAGYDVLGCNEIDKRMITVYKTNHDPKYAFLEGIQTFKDRRDLPDELYQLDILDGSPPCSSFSMIGNREKDWGKEKKFDEGQSLQVLDTLFFDFIALAKKIQPKIVVAENVLGLFMGNARQYVIKILSAFENAGYYVQHHLLDSSKMGVPQRRERIFFIAFRKDLAKSFLYQKDLFTVMPKLILKFKEKLIPFSVISDDLDTNIHSDTKSSRLYDKVQQGLGFETQHEKGHYFNHNKAHHNMVINTITSNIHAGTWHHKTKRLLNTKELSLAGSFPSDFNYLKIHPKYIIGMSVPPVMMAQIANQIYLQWLSKL